MIESKVNPDDDPNADLYVPPGRLTRLARSVLSAWGMGEDAAATTAAVLVDTDLSGIDSHGVSMLPTYDALRRAGRLDPTAAPTTLRDHPVTALLDAGGGLGHPAGAQAMRMAVAKARDHGLAAVAVRRSRHFGAAGYYARLASASGLIGLVTSTARTPCVTPTRARAPRLPTNPLAFAAPSDAGEFVLDMATSTTAVNKVKVHGYHGRALPAGWVLDAAGDSVTDAGEALSRLRTAHDAGISPLGATAELGSHKGYGLSVMVHLLATTLSGTSWNPDGGEADDVGHFFLAVDPGAFGDRAEFASGAGAVLEALRGTEPIDPDRPVLVAGDPEAASRARRSAEGIPLAGALVAELREVCARAGVDFALD